MKEQNMIPNEEITIHRETRMQLGAALNQHAIAKDSLSLDLMRQEKTMDKVLALAKTREGLAALLEMQNK